MADLIRIGVVGARGHVGQELVRLVAAHPRFRLAYVASRELAGQAVERHMADAPAGLVFAMPTPDAAATAGCDALVLALPNGKAAPYVESVEAGSAETVLLDLSADYRFDDAWAYGLPETGACIGGRRRISNPGCYATAMQLAIAPMLDMLEGPAQCFGVSGYSGAGTAPSPRNDPALLRDNLMPYALTGHVHEREVARHLGHPVEFMPHVAPHFRGLMVTTNLHLRGPCRLEEVLERYHAAYAGCPLVRVLDEAPWVTSVAGRHHAEVGGFALTADGRRLVVVCVLDNLLKGAATQALQNLNLAFGLPDTAGIPLEPPENHA